MALGSQRSGIVRLILLSGLKLAAAGCVIGLVGAYFASRLLESLVFHVSTRDPVVFVLASIVVLALAMVASLLPARRAATMSPVKALRAD
jgi:ABC-type antimicrobial peptide transport system permease subunit